MSKNLYDILWVTKSSTDADIKKAYRKQAMKYHPDRNKGDKASEEKFKEINSAYDVLSDKSKRKQYDTFWSTSWANPFWWGGASAGAWFWWFEDMFSNQTWYWSTNTAWGFEFNMEDLFWWGTSRRQTRQAPKKEKKPETLDFEKTYEVPIFDLVLGCKIEVSWVYWTKVKLKIPKFTKPWTKFRVKWLWKKESWKEWNLIIKIEAKMPKHISEVDMWMLERISENIGY